eukprot:4829658-Pyramimonas_sp.AAC.1
METGDGSGSGGKKGAPKRQAGAPSGLPKELAGWMQTIEKRLAPPAAVWPKPGGTAPWHESATGNSADPDKKSKSAKLAERITELKEALKKLPPADERNTDLRSPIEK